MTAYVFIPMFVVCVLLYGIFIWRLAIALGPRISSRAWLVGVLAVISGILAGVVLMFQPFWAGGFRIGFWFVFISTLSFVVWSHVTPQRNGIASQRAAAELPPATTETER